MGQDGRPLEELPPPDSLLEAHIETRLGGLFYLINLALFLEVYGDFTTPVHTGIALSPWDFVAVLGQELLGEEVHQDPVWPLLARLAGRGEDDAPGADFDPPGSWRIPAPWLASFVHEGIWEWEASGARLRARHPAGFLVLDMPLDGDDAMQQLVRETRDWSGSEAREWRHGVLGRAGGDETPLQRWIGWLMPYVDARLRRALGLDAADDLPHLLYAHAAYVCVTPTHLDVTFALQELPIEIRLAGLDRDPGWVPAAGRYIAFHFT
jgi:hypothetical protein